jgi:hypothetical protein
MPRMIAHNMPSIKLNLLNVLLPGCIDASLCMKILI